ncbi:uncharacterized [Tachysurus ichikawai]
MEMSSSDDTSRRNAVHIVVEEEDEEEEEGETERTGDQRENRILINTVSSPPQLCLYWGLDSLPLPSDPRH